jgi:hypothetical protein
LFLFIAVMLIGCDAVQGVRGYVLDRQTGKPIDSVAIGKQAKEDPTNSFTRRTYSNKEGYFEFHGIGGSNAVELYFNRSGYKTIKKEYPGVTDSTVVYLEKVN